jgi:glutathione S-transferase
MRARLAIVAAKVKVEIREVVLRSKPSHLIEISPKGTVPVLWLQDGKVIDESLDVMHWALAQNFPSEWLILDPEQQRQCNDWITLLDGEFKYNLDRYKYPHRPHLISDTTSNICDPLKHRLICENILKYWNEVLSQTEAYLFGAQPSFADYAVFPFVRQFRMTDEIWFDSNTDLKSLAIWMNRLLYSFDFDRAMEKHSPWQPGDTPIVFPG